MADRANASITIDAPAAAVLDVIADFAAYPQWATQIRRVEILKTDPDGRASQVRMAVDAGVLRDDYVLAYSWLPDTGGVSWQLVRGQMQKAQQGSYTLRADGPDRTEVRYELAIDLAVPLPGLIKRKAENMIIKTALSGLKKRVESMTGAAG